jgi:hypothetical protein
MTDLLRRDPSFFDQQRRWWERYKERLAGPFRQQ